MARPLPSLEELQPYMTVTFARSPGPGGQNVNKVNTRVILLLNFRAFPGWDLRQKDRIGERLTSRLSADGQLRVSSSRERTQARNRRAAEQRLMELLEQALHETPLRAATRPTQASRRKRLEEKKQRGQRVQQRRPPRLED